MMRHARMLAISAAVCFGGSALAREFPQVAWLVGWFSCCVFVLANGGTLIGSHK